ncbi:alpha/beta hydrolase [Flammeovirga pacifica]|uniref:Esterase n=1 Tax=Flammeovirga pacifica TaxID=915059 RepID=A0A1S1YUY4_FLAPC|nr:alpha/beta hydrolase [Flammeovirga pacifica]OHX64826.1 esterase [Flammeovirga pacifica]
MKRIFFLLQWIMFISIGGYAQVIVPLWDIKDLPNYQKSNDKEVIPPKDITFIMKVQTPTLEIYLPSKQSSNGKGILIIPGGGYGGVAYDWEGTDVAKWCNSMGLSAFVLKYRMPQAASVKVGHKAPIQDAQRAMRYIRSRADEFYIDKDQLGVIGFSAGGHLASTLGTHQEIYYDDNDAIDKEDFHPNFMMLIYPVITMEKGVTHMGSRNNLIGKNPSEEMIKKFSNELQISDTTPPTFLLHSGDDKAVPVENSIRFYQALLKAKRVADMHIYPAGGHGFGLGKSNKDAPDWREIAEDWLNRK